MSKKGASMEEGVGLQCQRAKVNVKERSKVNKHARVQTRSKQKGLGFKARSKLAERYSREVQSNQQAVLPFLFLEL